MEEVQLRPRRRWGLYGAVLGALLCIGLGVAAILRRAESAARTSAIARILAVLDRGYQECMLGAPSPDAELGRRALLAQLSGDLSPTRRYVCAHRMSDELAKLDALRTDDKALDVFWLPTSAAVEAAFPDGNGICEHVATVRDAARDLGVDTAAPDCAPHLERLAATVQADRGQLYRAQREGADLLIDVDGNVRGKPSQTFRRTRDGKTFDEAPVLQSAAELVMTANGVVGLEFVDGDERAHYALLEGNSWHAGARAPFYSKIARRTASGWTFLGQENHDVLVARFDPRLDKVIGTTSIPALHGRTAWPAVLRGLIDSDGNATALLISRNGGRVTIESHRVLVDGKPDPVVITTVEGATTDPDVLTCRGPKTMFIVIKSLATLVTTDGGRSFVTLEQGRMSPQTFTCDDEHLWAASARAYVVCDQRGCQQGRMPLSTHGATQMDLELVDGTPHLLVLLAQYALLFKATPDLSLVSAWTWQEPVIEPAFLIEGAWFLPRE